MSARILAVDDAPANLRLLQAVLVPQGYEVLTAATGGDAMEVAASGVDLVLLDVHLPDMTGFDVCQKLRADPATATLPVVMITATATQQRVAGIEAGADDFLPKPFDRQELLARVRSLLRIKSYQDELAEERALLAQRVNEQVAELERLSTLRRFLPEPLVEAISGDPSLLDTHRREIAVIFADLRGFTAFSAMAEPEEVIEVLGGWYRLIGDQVRASAATVGHLAGDGVMLFWNDPLPCDDLAGVATTTALKLVDGVDELNDAWRKLGYTIGVGVGVALGYATIGMIGFEGRFEYSPLGPVVNLAARLSDEARDGRTILANQRAHALLGDRVDATEIPDGLELRGFPGRVPVWEVHGVDGVRRCA